MTQIEKHQWGERSYAIEELAAALKVVARGLGWAGAGCPPVVHGLAAIEGLAWGLRDAVSRYPTETAPEPAPEPPSDLRSSASICG
jgi:hypothetical protein